MRHEKTVSVSKIKPVWEPWEEDETPRKIIQENVWPYYPSEPFTLDCFTMRHPVLKKIRQLKATTKQNYII